MMTSAVSRNTSQCSTRCVHLSFSHTWEIRNFEWFLSNKNRLRSCQFICPEDDHSWNLVLYLKGSKDDYNQFMSLYLYYNASANGDRSVRASYEFAILNSGGAVVHNHRSKDEGYMFQLGSNLCNWGVHRFVRSQDVLDNNWIQDDRLILRCDIIEMRERTFTDEEMAATNQEGVLDLSPGLTEFFLKKEFTDLVIEAGEKRLEVHKVILCSASKVFKSMFEACNFNENKDSRIRIDDFDYEVVRAMVQFLYTKKIERIDALASELILIADKYDIQHLKRFCEAYLVGQINFENALKLLALSQHCGCNMLESKCVHFIARNAKFVFSNKDWTHFNLQDSSIPSNSKQARYSL